MSENKHTRKIPLTQGKFATVDAEDFDQLNSYKWYANKKKNTYYAARNLKLQNGKKILMHREILGLEAGDGLQADHKSGNGLDNRRANLRMCNQSQNNQNRHSFWGTSKFKGVYWNKPANKWMARITLEGKLIYLGCFDFEIDAARAYDVKARELFGEFAKCNFIY